MRIIVWDVLMSGFVVLAIAVVVPVPWLLASSRGAMSGFDTHSAGCGPTGARMLSVAPPIPTSLTALWLMPRPRAHDHCPPKADVVRVA